MVIAIINDDIAEPRESFICTLQEGIVDSVQAIFPSQVTIEIRDDDGEHMHVFYCLTEYICLNCCFLIPFPSELVVRWATDFYEFQETGLATVELVIESKFEVTQVAISGRPSRIPDSDPCHHEPLLVCGPQVIPGNVELKPNYAALRAILRLSHLLSVSHPTVMANACMCTLQGWSAFSALSKHHSEEEFLAKHR